MSVSIKGVVATLAAASLIVVGLDYASLAATGDSFILGRHNRTPVATELTRTNSGPALILNSSGNQSPSLQVSSKAKVRRLNADRVDGWNGRKLASKATTYQIGKRGLVVPGIGIWSIKPKPGNYQVSFSVLATPDSNTPDLVPGMICGLLDVDTLGPNTFVYTADSGNLMQGNNGTPIAMSGAEMVHINKTANPGLYCGSNSATYTLFTGTVSITKITSRKVKTAPRATLPFGPKPRVLH